MEEIIINKCYIENNDKIVKICSNIQSKELQYKLWFEVEEEYKEYLVYEKEDAFLVAILPYAIKKELDIVVKGKISEKLFYQLNTYLLPILCKKFNKRIIKINSEIDNIKYNKKNAVGTGVSCGIDSFYTIQNHCNRKEQDYNITHLTFFNAGASGEYGGDKARELYKKRMKFAKDFAINNNFKFVCVDSNMNEFLMMNHEKTHTFRSLSCVLILQKLFSKYYYSSACEFDRCNIDADNGCGYFDNLTLPCLSTEDVIFYSAGTEINRIGKVDKVTNFTPSYNHLNVCIKEERNCGECEKCRRTLLELDSLGKLHLYKNVFNIDKFNKEKNKNLIFLMKKRRIRKLEYIESYNQYKIRGVKIPLSVRLVSLIPNKEYFKYIIYKMFPKDKLRKFLKFDKNPRRKHDGWND